jgi:hypothetical protein
VAARLEELGIAHVDVSLEPAFREGEDRFFIDVVHTERNANRVIAKIVLDALRDGED